MFLVMHRLEILCAVRGVTLSLVAAFAGCGGGSEAAMFRDVTAATGLDFAHTVDPTGKFPLPEVLGAGCAVFDANGDGRLDLYFTDAGRFGGAGAANALFLRSEDGRYQDATADSGLGDEGFGMGVAVGDLDNDGDLDVYVGNYGGDALYRNEGGGKFTDITKSAGIDNDKWTSSIAFLDYDSDGLLDIFVVNYVVFDEKRRCENPKSGRDYCGPQMFKGEPDVLYRNKGGGVFEDVSEAVGISAVASNGLGLVVEDFNDDGWADVFVANDAEANHLWMNTKQGGFQEEALSLGVAVNAFGVTEASMGVAAGDIDGDGDCDLFMTHLMNERNTLYVRTDYGFEDGSRESGLAAPSFPFTGFGTVMFDADHDGDLDLAIANGRVMRGDLDARAGPDPLWGAYAEPNQFFLGDGKGKFTDVSKLDSAFCGAVEITRALVLADLDDDGDLEMVVGNCRGPARIYENVTKKAGGWLRVRAVDAKLRRDMYGAVIRVHAQGRVLRRTVGPGRSYISSSMIDCHFGLGGATSVDRIEVRWPGGATETFPGCAANQSVTLTRGQGK